MKNFTKGLKSTPINCDLLQLQVNRAGYGAVLTDCLEWLENQCIAYVPS